MKHHWIVVVLGIGAFSGCASEVAEEEEPLRFVFSPKFTSNPVFSPGIDGARTRAQQLSATGDREVVVEVASPETLDATLQTSMIQDAIDAATTDGIIVACSDPADQQPVLDGSGAPVISWDSECIGTDYLTHYSVDNEAGGALAARVLADLIGGEGEVAILNGESVENLAARSQGFRDELAANYPNITVVEEVECFPPSNDPACPGMVDAVHDEHPELKGWFFAAVWMRILARGRTRGGLESEIPLAQRWIEASEAGTVQTVAFDALPETFSFVRDRGPEGGRVQALFGQKYWGWGYDTVGLLYDHLVNDVQLEHFTDSGTDIICPNNVDVYQQGWTSNNFDFELPACSLVE